MQLVVMAAVLALAGAEQDCSSGCRPKNISLPVDTCGTTEFIDTTICEGQCFQKVKNDTVSSNLCYFTVFPDETCAFILLRRDVLS